jgi:hypothetical protein
MTPEERIYYFQDADAEIPATFEFFRGLLQENYIEELRMAFEALLEWCDTYKPHLHSTMVKRSLDELQAVEEKRIETNTLKRMTASSSSSSPVNTCHDPRETDSEEDDQDYDPAYADHHPDLRADECNEYSNEWEQLTRMEDSCRTVTQLMNKRKDDELHQRHQRTLASNRLQKVFGGRGKAFQDALAAYESKHGQVHVELDDDEEFSGDDDRKSLLTRLNDQQRNPHLDMSGKEDKLVDMLMKRQTVMRVSDLDPQTQKLFGRAIRAKQGTVGEEEKACIKKLFGYSSGQNLKVSVDGVRLRSTPKTFKDFLLKKEQDPEKGKLRGRSGGKVDIGELERQVLLPRAHLLAGKINFEHPDMIQMAQLMKRKVQQLNNRLGKERKRKQFGIPMPKVKKIRAPPNPGESKPRSRKSKKRRDHEEEGNVCLNARNGHEEEDEDEGQLEGVDEDVDAEDDDEEEGEDLDVDSASEDDDEDED